MQNYILVFFYFQSFY